MKEVKITISGHLNEPIRGLACTDFEIDGYDVTGCTEKPQGSYTLCFVNNNHPVKKLINYLYSIFMGRYGYYKYTCNCGKKHKLKRYYKGQSTFSFTCDCGGHTYIN